MRGDVGLLLIAGVSSGLFGREDPSTELFELDNGLTALLRPVEGAREAALLTVFSIGGDHDPEGRSGLAHLIEHLYVTAAAGRARARSIREYMRRYPAGWNAQTADDYTLIAAVFPREALEEELRDAAARMGDLRIAASDLDREKPRLVAEVENMFGGMPALAARNLARERIRPTPLGGRRGGVPAHVKAITLREVQDRWRRYYKPANARIVLAGGFDPATARASVRRLYGALPRGEPAPRRQASGAPRVGQTERIAIMPNAPRARPYACLAYAPPPPESDLYAPFLVLVARMRMRAALLGAGRGHLPLQYAVLDDPAALFLGAPVGVGETPEQVVRRLEEFVSSAIEPKRRAMDLVTTRNAFGVLLGIAPFPRVMLTRSPYGVAFSLARRDQLGIDAGALNEALESVTDGGLRRVAKAIFARSRRAAVVVIPRAPERRGASRRK